MPKFVTIRGERFFTHRPLELDFPTCLPGVRVDGHAHVIPDRGLQSRSKPVDVRSERGDFWGTRLDTHPKPPASHIDRHTACASKDWPPVDGHRAFEVRDPSSFFGPA
jgi:hypothetical protein